MPEPEHLHPDLILLGEEIARSLGQGYTTAVAELVATLTEAQNVRTVPSDRFRTFNVTVPAGGKAIEVIPAALDRARFTMLPVTVADLWISDSGASAGALGAALVPQGVGLILDTKGALFACSATGVTLSFIVEQWDATL